MGKEQETVDLLFILSDSQAAIHPAINLSNSAPSRSGIEKDLKNALLKRRDQDIAIAWIRSHIGIAGNVKADHRAAFGSILGEVSGSPQTATEEGVRAAPKAIRRENRVPKAFGLRRSDWHRKAASA